MTVADLAFGSRWPESQMWGEVVGRGPADRDRVALTFDDGPNPLHTPRLLAALERAGARATFFVIGRWAAREPGLLRELRAAGHALGNHSHTHPTLPRLSRVAVADELERCREAVEAAGVGFSRVGERMLMRPPYGRRRRATLRVARDLGYLPVTWSVDCFDWREGETVESIAARGSAAAAGDVVLMHDGRRTEPAIDRSRTVAAVERVLQELGHRGMELVTLPELVAENARR